VRLTRRLAHEHVRMYSVCALGVLTSVRVARADHARRASDGEGGDVDRNPSSDVRRAG
jgi:hypothetical protein